MSCLALCWLLSGPPGTLSNNLILHATPLGLLLFRHQGQFYIFPQISSRIFVTVKFPLFVPGLFCNMFLVVLLTSEPTTPPSRVSSLHFFWNWQVEICYLSVISSIFLLAWAHFLVVGWDIAESDKLLSFTTVFPPAILWNLLWNPGTFCVYWELCGNSGWNQWKWNHLNTFVSPSR